MARQQEVISSSVVRPKHLELLTTKQAAQALSVSEQFLEIDRSTRRHGITFLKIGRMVRYRPADLEAWLEKHAVGLECETA